jgi:hypothetical protein
MSDSEQKLEEVLRCIQTNDFSELDIDSFDVCRLLAREIRRQRHELAVIEAGKQGSRDAIGTFIDFLQRLQETL